MALIPTQKIGKLSDDSGLVGLNSWLNSILLIKQFNSNTIYKHMVRNLTVSKCLY